METNYQSSIDSIKTMRIASKATGTERKHTQKIVQIGAAAQSKTELAFDDWVRPTTAVPSFPVSRPPPRHCGAREAWKWTMRAFTEGLFVRDARGARRCGLEVGVPAKSNHNSSSSK